MKILIVAKLNMLQILVKKQLKDVFDSSWVSEVLERTSQDWAAMFGHYGEVASIDLHLRRKFRKAMFF